MHYYKAGWTIVIDMGGNIEKKFERHAWLVNKFTEKDREKNGEFYAPKDFLIHTDLLELLALREGLKPAVGVRMPFIKSAWDALKRWAKKNNFKYGHTTQKYIINTNDNICQPIPLGDPRQGDVYAIIADSFDLVKRGADSYARDSVEFGRVMGYPECCLEFAKTLNNNLDNKEKVENDYIWSRIYFRSFRNSKKFSPWLNVFQPNHLITHTPCQLDCNPSKKYAREMYKIVKRENSELAESYLYFHQRSSLFWNCIDYVLLDGKWKKNRFFYNDAFTHLMSDRFYYAAPDVPLVKRLEGYAALIGQGDSLEVFDDCVKVFSGDDLLGLIEKKSKYECILTTPSERLKK